VTALDIPFAFDHRGRTATSGDDDHIRDLIKMVLFTNPGERVNRPDFGCGLKQLVFAPASDTLAATTRQLVHGALLQWLSDVILVEAVEVELGDGMITVNVAYSRRDNGERREDSFSKPIAAP
jgi:phage baseplate assembly protein W